jgi:ABC-type sugar transport system ATPase subunit
VLCDRLLVLARGRVVAELPPDAPETQVGEAMLGGVEETIAEANA